MFWFVVTGFFATLVAASFLAGRYGWRWYFVPGVLALLYVVFMGYVIAYTSTCTDCRGYQSGPEEVRAIGFVYGTAVVGLSLTLWSIFYALGRFAFGRR